MLPHVILVLRQVRIKCLIRELLKNIFGDKDFKNGDALRIKQEFFMVLKVKQVFEIADESRIDEVVIVVKPSYIFWIA